MKKKFLVLLFVLTIPLSFIFTACNLTNVKFHINFIVDEKVYAIVDSSGNEYIQLPAEPTKDGYDFVGWYLDKDTWQTKLTSNAYENTKITLNVNVFAYFIEKEASIVVNNNSYSVNIGANFELDITAINLPVGTEIYAEIYDTNIIQRVDTDGFVFKGICAGETFITISSNLINFEPLTINVTCSADALCDMLYNYYRANCVEGNLYEFNKEQVVITSTKIDFNSYISNLSEKTGYIFNTETNHWVMNTNDINIVEIEQSNVLQEFGFNYYIYVYDSDVISASLVKLQANLNGAYKAYAQTELDPEKSAEYELLDQNKVVMATALIDAEGVTLYMFDQQVEGKTDKWAEADKQETGTYTLLNAEAYNGYYAYKYTPANL